MRYELTDGGADRRAEPQKIQQKRGIGILSVFTARQARQVGSLSHGLMTNLGRGTLRGKTGKPARVYHVDSMYHTAA